MGNWFLFLQPRDRERLILVLQAILNILNHRHIFSFANRRHYTYFLGPQKSPIIMAETNNDLVVPSDKVAESDPVPASVAPESPPTAESKTKNDNVPPADDKKEGNGETAAADTTGENSSKKKDSTAAKPDVAAPESSSDTKGSTDDAEATAEKDSSSKEKPKEAKPNDLSSGPVVSSSKKTRPPYKYDPEKVVLRFLFANRDGLTVTVECKPGDTVGEVKGQLLSVWPEGTREENLFVWVY